MHCGILINMSYSLHTFQLAGRDKQADMDTDKKSDHDWVTPVQAINDDYKDTGYDRGHLNPNFMHCNK